MDDFVVFAEDKATLWEILHHIEDFLAHSLRLKIHQKKAQVCPTTEGVDFLGYRVYPEHRRLRRSSGVRFQRRLHKMQQDYQAGHLAPAQIQQRIASWVGHAKHADTYGLRRSLLEGAVFRRA